MASVQGFLTALSKSLRERALPLCLAFAVLFSSLGVTWWVWELARQNAMDELNAEFDLKVREMAARIEQRISNYESVLRGTYGFFLSSQKVERAEFKSYVTSLDLAKSHQGMMGIGLAMAVPKDRKAAHEAFMRREIPDYAVFPDNEGKMLAPVVLREPPPEKGHGSVGFDLLSEPRRREALIKARDTGRMSVSGKLSLLARGNKNSQPGFLMFLPLYAGYGAGSVPSDLDGRRRDIAGWVYTPIRMSDMMAGLSDERAADLDYEIFDGENQSDDDRLFDSDGASMRHRSEKALLTSTYRIDAGCHSWMMVVRSLPSFEARMDSGKPSFIAGSGVALSLLFTLLIYLLASGRMRAFALANRMNDSLKRSEARYARVMEGSEQGFWEFDIGTGNFSVSPGFEALFGYKPGERDLNRRNWFKYANQDDLAVTVERIEDHLRGRTPLFNTEMRCQTKDGKWKWVHYRGKVTTWAPDGAPLLASGTVTDITERKKVERALLMTQFSLEKAVDPVLWISADGRIRFVNEAACSHLGYSRDELLALTISDIDPAFPPDVWREWLARGKADGANKIESLHRTKDGHMIPVEVSINDVEYEGEQYSFAFIRDISAQKRSEELIWHQANFDALTGLPNRWMFLDRLHKEIQTSQRTGQPLALMFLDLDYFKDVNDTLGHGKGDNLLKMTAERLNSCVRKTDTVARLGGDEFTIILPCMTELKGVERIAKEILDKLSEPFHLEEDIAYVTSSIGITFYPNDATDSESLLKNADQAMYAAKELGRKRFSYYDSALQDAALNRRHLISDLHDALESDQFRVVYQPIVELATGVIHKAEALVRWQHPERGMVSPAEFIPIAEEVGMIHDIGNLVFRQAAYQVVQWREAHHAGFQISVNISPMQFKFDGIRSAPWFTPLQQMSLPGQGIVVEITEGLLLDANDNVKDQLLALRDAGIEVALDDFGTGYSSLSYLKKFDIDYIKIDQSFVRNLTAESDDLALCEAMIIMAHRLGIKVIAEGVETEEQRGLLLTAGCDFAQGYFFSRPVPADRLNELIAASLSGVEG